MRKMRRKGFFRVFRAFRVFRGVVSDATKGQRRAIKYSGRPDLGPHCDDMFDWLKKPGPARGLSPEVRREPTRAVRPPGGRYEPVCRYVENRYADTVVLTFAEVEDLLGFSLPDLARVQLEWWASSLPVASRTVTPNLAAEIVAFERTS